MNSDYLLPQSSLIKDTVRIFWEVSRRHELSLRETIIPKGLVEII